MTQTAQAICIREFEEIRVGDSARITREITPELVKSFADLCGDYNPLHMDERFAAGTRFGRPVAHGMIVASFVSTLVGVHLPGPGALWTQQSFRWPRPVFAGDTIEIEVRVTHKSAAIRSVCISVEAWNQSGERVMEGKGTATLLDSGNRAGRGE